MPDEYRRDQSGLYLPELMARAPFETQPQRTLVAMREPGPLVEYTPELMLEHAVLDGACVLAEAERILAEFTTRRRRRGMDDPMATNQTFIETLMNIGVAGTLLNTYTTAVSVIPAQALYTLPPNYLQIGKSFRVTVLGGLSNIVTTPGTTTMQINMGSIAAFSTGAIQLNATAHVVLPFRLEAYLTMRSVGTGTTATFMGQGVLTGVHFTVTIAATDAWGRVSAADAAVSHVVLNVPVAAPAVGAGFNSTIANILDFFLGFSISNVGNGVQVQQYFVEALN